MLTNIFYYNHYKPYILRTSESSSSTPVKKSKIADTSSNSDSYKVLLNKSMKTDVVKYVKDVSSSVVDTKDAAKNTVRDMEEFNKNSHLRGIDTAKKWVAEDLEEFAKSYNKGKKFLQSQKHSQTLKTFGEELTENVDFNRENLGKIGFSVDEEANLVFDETNFMEKDSAEINFAIGENLDFFNNVNHYSLNLLNEPLTEHMKFKSLGYYYNYKFGKMEEDTFRLIETGLIIDKAV